MSIIGDKNFTHVTYIEYVFDEHFKPKCIDYIIDGWVPTKNISAQKRRHFFHLSTDEKTADAWELKSDRDYIFKPFWTPLKPKPHLIPPQDKWLDFVYEKLLDT